MLSLQLFLKQVSEVFEHNILYAEVGKRKKWMKDELLPQFRHHLLS